MKFSTIFLATLASLAATALAAPTDSANLVKRQVTGTRFHAPIPDPPPTDPTPTTTYSIPAHPSNPTLQDAYVCTKKCEWIHEYCLGNCEREVDHYGYCQAICAKHDLVCNGICAGDP
ncbi:hypothetical protein HDV00_012034 [Rhizophlyctis rosea]|nr:hypothetical protein HDV00_012034 [Rhizophlyctis rosea]